MPSQIDPNLPRTLCFGGSFNPVHNGHLICAQMVAEENGYQRVKLIPAGHPPHKPLAADLADPADRLAMCQLATADRPLFEVSDIETRRDGPSFTIDTARALKRQGLATIHWLIGADMLMYLPQWHCPLELLEEVDFVIMARPGWTIDWPVLPAAYQCLQDHVVPAPLIDISSTEIRRRVRQGLPIDSLTPPAVARYIAQHHLYRP